MIPTATKSADSPSTRSASCCQMLQQPAISLAERSMDAMTRMKIAWASFLLLFLLLFTCHSPVSAPFPDQATLTAIRNLLHDLPDPGLPQSEMRHIFHYDLNMPGPLQQAYNAQPQLYATVLFTVFRDHLTRVAFVEGGNGQRDRLLVLLKGHRMLPNIYAGIPEHRAATIFDDLHTAWTHFLAGVPLPGAGDPVPIPPLPDADQNVPLPEVIQPLFVWVVNNRQRRQQAGNDVQIPAELPYRELLRRFLDEYVANYNVQHPFKDDFTRNPSCQLRTAVLKALYWMLVVRPFQVVVAARPDLFPGVNAEELLPALNRRHEGGGGRPRPLGPVPLIPDPPPALDDLDPPVRRGPEAPDRIEDIFRDRDYIRARAEDLQEQQIFRPTVEAVRALYETGSDLQRAMNTAPPLYAAVLFTVFRGHFAEVAFADDLLGRRDHLLVLLHDLRLLPAEYGPGEIAAVMNYHRLEAEWRRYLEDDLVLPQLMEVINANVPQGGDRVQVTMPAIFRPLFEARRAAQFPYSGLRNRFLDPYVRRYTLHRNRVSMYLSWRHRICPTRRSHLLAIFWMVVVRPFQQAVIEHRRLFPNGEEGDGGPGDGGGGPGGGNGRRGGRGGRGGGNRGRGAPGGRGGAGGGEGDDPPPPPRRRPPQNPPPRRNPPQNRQPAQPSCSSSAALSTARTSRSQQGTCSAAKAPTRIQPGRAAKTGSKHPAPDEEEEEEEEDSDEDSDDDDDGPSLPPAKRPRRRDHPPRDPDAGGAGAGMTF